MVSRISTEQLIRTTKQLEQDSNSHRTILGKQLDEEAEKWAKENGWFFRYYEGLTGISRKKDELPSKTDFEIIKEAMNLEDVLDSIFEHVFEEEHEDVSLEDIQDATESMKKMKKLGKACVVVNGTASQEIVSWLKESGYAMRMFDTAFVFAENEGDLPIEEELKMRCGLTDAFSSFLSVIVETP